MGEAVLGNGKRLKKIETSLPMYGPVLPDATFRTRTRYSPRFFLYARSDIIPVNGIYFSSQTNSQAASTKAF